MPNAIPAATPATSNQETFAALFEESLTRKEMRTGEVITAEVVRVDVNYVVVNAGLKSESFILIEEFKNDKGEVEVKPGDFVSVAIEALEDGYGETRLSRDKAKRLAAWLDLEKALEAGTLVKGMISGKVKGGLTVMTNGIRAFLPGSLVDIRPVKDTMPYEGKEMEFKVIKLDRKRNNVVVSRRAVLEASQGAERQALLANLQEGAVVKGIVKNITDYGAFVDLGGIDGLLHITDLAWRRVKHPSEVLAVGDEVTAKVLKFDTEKNRVSLGMKQLGEDPWVGLSRRYPAGTRLFGKVTNLTDYGAFVEVEPRGKPLRLVPREARLAVAVLERFDRDRHEIADLHFDFTPVVAKLLDRDHGLGLEPSIDHHDVLVDAHDLRSNHFADPHLLAVEALLEQRGKALLRGDCGRNS